MLVPTPMVELDESDPSFGQSPGKDAVGGKGSGFFGLGTVAIEDGFRLAGEIRQFWNRGLKAKGHLVLFDTVRDDGVPLLFELNPVERCQIAKHCPTARSGDSCRVGQEEHGIFSRAETDPLVSGGKKAGSPHSLMEGLGVGGAAGARNHHDEGGEILVLCPQAIGGPCPEGRAAGKGMPCLKQCHGGIVVDGFGVESADEAYLIGMPSGVGKEFAEMHAGVAVSVEPKEGGGDRVGFLMGGHPCQALAATD